MNERGFTFIEVLAVLVLISLVFVLIVRGFGSTVSVSRNEAYEIMKNNIIRAGNSYVNECVSGTIDCDFSFDDNNRFSVSVLKGSGYFSNFISPIDGKDLSDCLIIEVTRDNGVIVCDLLDYCY